jgi:hypothetical protein
MFSLRLQMTIHIREWDRVMTKAESLVNPPREWMYTRFCSLAPPFDESVHAHVASRVAVLSTEPFIQGLHRFRTLLAFLVPYPLGNEHLVWGAGFLLE